MEEIYKLGGRQYDSSIVKTFKKNLIIMLIV